MNVWRIGRRFLSSINTRLCSSSSHADSFGKLSCHSAISKDSLTPNKDMDPDELHQAKISDTLRPRPKDYLKKIHELLEISNLKGSLHVLEVEMKEECVKPTKDHYRILIHACGTKGYTKKAFELYKTYTDRRFEPNYGIYADLFNSCFNSPFPEYSLRKAINLRRKLILRNAKLPQILAHNMIKAFARCGDLETGFEIVDEMKDKFSNITTATYNHLLMGCISDKNSGFRHALMVWRKMLQKRVSPDYYSFSLMLEATQRCSIGHPKLVDDILIASMTESQVRSLAEERKKLEGKKLTENTKLQVIDNFQKMVPNLLRKDSMLEGIVGISLEVSTPESRLSLIGGTEDFVDLMLENEIRPDSRIFTQLLTLIPSSSEAEMRLLELMDRTMGHYEEDVGFFNELIKRRAFRNEHESGRDVLSMISSRGLSPDVRTFGCLALTCDRARHVHTLIRDMKNRGVRLNNEILGALIRKAAHRRSPRDLVFLLNEAKKADLKVSPKVVRTLQRFYEIYRKSVVDHERGKSNPILRNEIDVQFKHWNEFVRRYKDWLKETEMESGDHVWKQFLTDKENNDEWIVKGIQNIMK